MYHSHATRWPAVDPGRPDVFCPGGFHWVGQLGIDEAWQGKAVQHCTAH